jgi:DNA repair exonuclease SbcCD ATPase subunit
MKPVSKIGAVLAAIAFLIAIDFFFVRSKYRNLVKSQTSIIEKNIDAIAEEKALIEELRNNLSECEEDNQRLVWSNSEYKDLLKEKEKALQDFSDTFSKELNIYEAEIAKLNKKDTAAANTIEDLNEALQQNGLRSEILDKIENLEAEREKLREEYSAKISTLNSIELRLVDLRAECERYQATDQGRKYTNITNDSCRDARKAEIEIKVLKNEIDLLRSLVEEADKQIDSFQGTL